MATSPERVRRGLVTVTAAAMAEVRAVSAAASKKPKAWRATMFEALPLVVSEYAPGSSSLALDWFEEIRAEASPTKGFTPTPRLNVTEDDVNAVTAAITKSLADSEQQFEADIERLMAEMTAELEAAVQKEVAAGFWDTITENADEDPEAQGWQRFTRDGACKFCRMLAGRGAVYTETTVNFAAHTTCHCVAGPSYDPTAPRADVMQYLGSKRKRTARERAVLREYLNHHFPDAPG